MIEEGRGPDPGDPLTRRPWTVFVVEDHPMYRDGLRATISSAPGFELVGEAPDGESGVEAVLACHPDLVLMDIRLPGMSGIEATRRICAAAPDVRVVILSMLEDEDSVLSAMRAGARGYLLKGAGRAQVLLTLEAVAHGDVIFGEAIAGRVIALFSTGHVDAVALAFPELTDRERTVLERLARGEDNGTIAQRLGMSEKTVRNHVSTILGKLQAPDRAHAIVRARDAGLGATPGR